MTRTSCEFWRDAAIRELYAAQNNYLADVEFAFKTAPFNTEIVEMLAEAKIKHNKHLDEAAKCMVASYHCFNHPQSFGI
jgi:hypothetical protein